MEFKDIRSKKTYTTKDGEEKTAWPIVGTLKILDDGKMFIELNMNPSEPYFVFARKERDGAPPAPAQRPAPASQGPSDEWED